MGVHGLWSVLSELCEKKPLTYLSGKKVAVDLSGWVVQAIQCKGLNTSKSPHLRNLFFRASRLLQLGVYPIFVIEGKPPSLKESVFKERNFDRHTENTGFTTSISRQTFDRILKQCQDLLACLGVPCIKSSGEGEAFCAFLCLNGVVQGVITEDNDAFLYGADVIFRDFSIEPTDSHVHVYSLKSKKNKQKLDRRKLVALALLLGCDYSKGVPGIGKETALKLLSELNCDDVLQRFKDWKALSESELFPGLNKNVKKSAHCTRCGHLGSSTRHKKDGCSACDSEITCYLSNPINPCGCPWHINNELMTKLKTELKIYNAVKNCFDFPNMQVVEEYLNYTDKVPCDENIDWKCPNLITFQEKAFNFLGWTFEYSYEKVLPLITAWQQFKLRTNSDKTNFIYEPVKAIKERHMRDISYLEVQWKLIDNEGDNDTTAENLITLEYYDQFSVCYKEIVDEFKSGLNEKKKSKNKRKKLMPVGGNHKIDDFFVQKQFKHEDNLKKSGNMDSIDTTNTSSKLSSEFDVPHP